MRQVDIAVRLGASGREFLRIVEVQARKRKMDSQFVDQIVGKARRVGAHRSTLVNTAGFTGPALRRVMQGSNLIDAAALELDKANDWPAGFPTESLELNVADRVRQNELTAMRYVNAVDSRI